MPLHSQGEGPSKGIDVIAEALSDIRWQSGIGLASDDADTHPSDGLFGGGELKPARQTSKLLATSPLPLYRLSKGIVPLGEAFRDFTELVGWRYLLLDEDQNAVAYSDVRKEKGVAKFVGFSEDRNAHFLQLAILKAEEFSDVRADDFELRLLSLPAVSLAMVWLVNAQDVFIPYADGYVSRNLRLKVLSRDQINNEIRKRISERNAASPRDSAIQSETRGIQEMD